MANPYRGEAELTINGTTHPMRLPLGVLAELEAELGCKSLVELAEKFESGRFSARDLLLLIRAGLKGAGVQMPAEVLDLAELAGGAIGAAKAAARLLRVTFALPGE
jgi:hypothetical protein